MLGINWLYDNGAEWSFKGASIALVALPHDLIVRTNGKNGVALCWNEMSKYRLVLKSTYFVRLSLEEDTRVQLSHPERMCWGTRPVSIEPVVYVARTITPDNKFDHVSVRVMNVQQQPHYIKAGTLVSDLEVLDLVERSE